MDDRARRKAFRILMHDGLAPARSLVLILASLTGMRVISRTPSGWTLAFSPWWLLSRRFTLRTWEIMAAARRLSWIAGEPCSVVRLARIRRLRAVPSPILRGEPLATYIACDNRYQQYLLTRDPRHLKAMAALLYVGESARRFRPRPEELYSVFYWWYSLKLFYARRFPSLFAPAPKGLTPRGIEDSMDSMLRALTAGDLTKTQAVLAHDTYAALKELNEKAREAHELKTRMKK